MNEADILIDFIKSTDNGARITDGYNWLYWQINNSVTNEGEWVVQSRPPYKKVTRCLYSGNNLEEALTALREE
jgi:hypothetical protein